MYIVESEWASGGMGDLIIEQMKALEGVNKELKAGIWL